MSERREPASMRAGNMALRAVVVSSLALSPTVAGAQPHEAQRNEAQASPRSAASLVTFTDGRLTLAADRPLLPAVLAELSAKAKIAIVVGDALAQERVAVELHEVTLEEAFGRLLAPYDAFYLYSAPDRSAGAISAIWVYSRGEGRALEPVPPSEWASTQELEQRLDDPDPNVRYEAYEAVIERQGDKALPILRKAFADGSDVVRFSAVYAAINGGLEIPTSDLSVIVLSDRSRDVRLLALEALATRPDAEPLVTSMQNDPDEGVANQAKETLRLLREAAERRKPKL
jgi:hypothetical protein